MVAPIVVFDLDGTLVDTAPDLVATLNVVFARIGLPSVAYAQARNMVGGGARKMIEQGLAAEGRTLVAPELDQLVRDFIDHYAAHIADNSRAFPGLRAVLARLAQDGCDLAVCTNKLEWLARKLLNELELAQPFAAICGGDTFGVQKPNPLFLTCTIRQAGAQADRAVMVGDSISDIAMAKTAGIPVIAVDYGYSDKPVAELGADRVISDLAYLPTVISEVMAGSAYVPVAPSALPYP
jgi:phosphoglycolate phosphatase